MFTITPGTIIDDRYRVISRVGSGGMADVYCAEDLQLGRRVAVKLLHERFAQDAEFVERFRREASSAASLSHANIVSVYDRGEWNGTYYIAMELLEGRSLDAIVREEAPLTPERSIELTEQVLRAARFAHKRGVVHRDLKPHNVIVDYEGRVKVTDFGIARAGASEITQTGSIMGTARYLSPEQAQGDSVGPSSDLYAIGILLYELLTGTVPFEGDSVVAIALRHLSEPPRPPSTLVSSISPNLDAIVLRALAKDPANRFADADEFLAALAGERERLRAEDGSQTATFTPMVLPVGGATPTQSLLPAQYGAGQYAPVEQGYWDSTATSIIAPGGGSQRRGSPAWPWALLGALLAAAAIVAIVVLVAPKHSTVPNVIGLTEIEAGAKLSGYNIVPTSHPSSAPAGTVYAQTPTAGTAISKGSTVAIEVSSGPEGKTVPDVTDETAVLAEHQLKQMDFRYNQTMQTSPTVPKGQVISTNPSAGSTASRDSIVQLVVSSGAPLTSLVNVVNLQFSNAQDILLADGFKIKEIPYPSDLTPGQVIAESPSSAKAPEGSTVKLTVATAPTRVAVPDVESASEQDAVSAVQALGLVASTTYVPTQNPNSNGLVITETPAPGSMVKKGSVVALGIGDYTGPTGNSGGSGATGVTGAT
jgi:beta-lactam-binding protein with PASTA domain/predicted Ser/Thr protein kinase